jgi:carbonic anhydrase
MKAVEITYRYEEASDDSTRSRPADSDAAWNRLNEGNRAFSALLDGLSGEGDVARRLVGVDARDLGLSSDRISAPKQHPFAAVLGCSDARVPIELIFSEGPNDLFVVRVAGNGLGNDVLGSLKYAFEQLAGSLKIVAVLGHSGCGAVTAAVDVFLNPAGYLMLATQHSLRSVVDRLLVGVQASARRLAEVFGPEVATRPGYRAALIEMTVFANAALGAYTVQQEIGREDRSRLRAVYGVYVLETRSVWAPRPGAEDCNGLADPPRDPADFVALGNCAARSIRITTLLGEK